MPVTVQLPGYNHAQPAVGLADILSSISNMRRNSKQTDLIDAQAENEKLRNQQAQVGIDQNKELADPTTQASAIARQDLAAQAAISKELGKKAGLSDQSLSPFDQVLDAAQNGAVVGVTPPPPGQEGPAAPVRKQMSGLEAIRAKDSPLFQTLERAFAAKTSAQGKIDSVRERYDTGPVNPDVPTGDQNKSLKNVQSMLESMRGNPAVQQAERDIYASQKADTLAKQYSDPNKMPPQMVKLLVSEVGKIAQGGSPTVDELKGLDPGTINGALAGVWGKFSNEPTAANAAEFIKQYQDYAHGVAADAQKQIIDRYGRIIDANKDQLGSKNYKVLQDQYINRFAKSEGSKKAPPHGNSIVQNGHTYSWNADTGKYE